MHFLKIHILRCINAVGCVKKRHTPRCIHKMQAILSVYDDSNIDNKEQASDQGIMMSNTATFTLHNRNIVKWERDKMGWVLRVFQSWKRSLIPTLLKSLVIPLQEYCCQLWNPWKTYCICYRKYSTNV